MQKENISITIQAAIGMLAVALFIIIYGLELLPHHGPPITILWIKANLGQWGLIILNIAIILAFLLLLRYRKPTRGEWASKGVFTAFVIALMTEMFGFPLMIYLFSPLANADREVTRIYFTYMGYGITSIGVLLSILGVILIALGWYRIHRADRLVTTGIYRWMRHPQYTGMFLFVTGWMLHWMTLITLILYPIIIGAYIWLASFEEKQLIAEFGEDYKNYRHSVKKFIPYII